MAFELLPESPSIRPPRLTQVFKLPILVTGNVIVIFSRHESRILRGVLRDAPEGVVQPVVILGLHAHSIG